MKNFFILALIGHDPVIPGARPEVLTKTEELARFRTAEEAGAFIEMIQSLNKIGYFAKPVLSDDASILRITRLVMDANENLDHGTARYYALLMAEAEYSDDYITFNELAQEAIRYRPKEISKWRSMCAQLLKIPIKSSS